MSKRGRLRGHVDRIGEGFIFGWVFDYKRPRHSVTFELFVRGEYRGQWHCSYLRSDLRQSGLGNGIHGFKVPLISDEDSTLSYSEIEFFIPQSRAFWVVSAEGQFLLAPTKKHLREGGIREFRRRIEKDRTPLDDDAVTTNFSRAVSERLSRLVTYKECRLGKTNTSDFTEFLRRLKGLTGDDTIFYEWYIHNYIFRFDPECIPLSKDESRFISRYIGETRAEILEPYFSILFKAVFPRKYRSVREVYPLYWWLVEGGRQLRLDYVCLPTDAVGRLTQTLQFGIGRSFPLSYFMLIFALRNNLVSPLSMLFPKGRQRVHEWCRAYAIRNKHLGMLSCHLSSSSDGDTPEIGLNEQSSRYCATEYARPSAAKSNVGSSVTVQLIGPFDKILGLGESARRLADALAQSGVKHKLTCYNDGIQSSSIKKYYDSNIQKADVNIIHVNLEQIPELFLKYGDLLKNSHNIVFPYWELNKLSSLHLIGLDFIDEIWCASDFIASLFQNYDICASNIRLPAKKFERATDEPLRNANYFTFLTTFDAHSWPQRKNPAGVVAAFLEAFGELTSVRLVIKTQNAESVHTEAQRQAWESLRQSCVGDSRITIINQTFTSEDQRTLLASADCLISLHRSEGLGIDILDAIASGLPVVATAYSGNLDICTAENSWLVEYDLIPVEHDDYVFVESGHLWAQPRHDSAVRALREVYSDHRLRQKKIIRGIADAERLNSEFQVSTRMASSLKLIQRRFIKPSVN